MDYYESAEDTIITRERALLELARHHCEDIEQLRLTKWMLIIHKLCYHMLQNSMTI